MSDRVVRAAVHYGADDVDGVTAVCGAGGECGGCRLRIERVLLTERPVELRVAS